MLLSCFTILTALALTTLGLADPAATTDSPRACGFKIAPCPEDMNCIPNSTYCTNLSKCPGTCVFKNTYPACGGFSMDPPPPCDSSSTCTDDPRLPLYGGCGMECVPDLPGVCVPKKLSPCNGFAGFRCPDGLFCYDDLRDDCDPLNGGFDCIGICM